MLPHYIPSIVMNILTINVTVYTETEPKPRPTHSIL
jgi:hypothetical protein